MLVIKTTRLRRMAYYFFLGLAAALAGIVLPNHYRPPETAGESLMVLSPAARPQMNFATARYRLERDMELSRQRENLTDLLAAAEKNEPVRAEVERELWRLSKTEAVEHEIETALAAEGRPEAMAALIEQEIIITVAGHALTAEEAARLGELASRIAGLDATAVRIVEIPSAITPPAS